MDILLPYLFAFVTSIPALVCFHIAWSGKQDETEFTTARLLLLVPTTLFPVGWLAFHAAMSEPLWKEFGDSVFYYMTRGSAAWVYFVPFTAANSQLATFRAFEKWMTLRRPGTHRTARSLYNVFSPPIARTIIFRWQADVVYLMLKPVELVLHCVVCCIQGSRNS